MEQDEFARRVLAALPRIVRQQLDLATAERIAQLLQGMHVDARALPDDAQLAYIERDGRSRGPLPQSALDMFIAPGERYRLQGSHAWETWPEPPEHEATVAPPQAFDEAVVAPVDEPPVEVPADRVEDEEEAPSVEDTAPVSPPPLPTEPSPPEAAPALDDEATADDALINPPRGEEGLAPAAEEQAESPAEAGADQPHRSRYGRLLVLLVIVGVAAWAYQHWMTDTRVDDTPPPAPAAHASHPADSATTAPVSATSVGTAPSPSVSAAAAGASSTPVPAASAPATGGTAVLPAAASTVIAPAATASAAPATASSVVPATASSAAPAHAGSAAAAPAAASSSPQG
jgi:hypothetical protein